MLLITDKTGACVELRIYPHHYDGPCVEVPDELEDDLVGRMKYIRLELSEDGVPSLPTDLDGWLDELRALEVDDLRNQKITEIRAKRNSLLRELDVVVSNPLRWNALSEDDRTSVSEYRQLLLDITDQTGFPDDVLWPEYPAALT